MGPDSGKTIEKKELVIVGAGGQARVVIDAAEAVGFQIHGIVDVKYKNQNEEIMDYPILGDLDTLKKFDPVQTNIAIALGDGHHRAKYFHKVHELGFSLPNIIHQRAILSKHLTLGIGVFINAGAIVNTQTDIGDNTIINTGVIIDHEVSIGKHCHIGPGAKIAGRVEIGDNCFIGIGASVIDYIRIGNNVTIGAGSVIIDNVESNATVVGVPGKQIS